MNHFLAQLVARSRGEAGGIRPRLGSRFEQAPLLVDGPWLPVEFEAEAEAPGPPFAPRAAAPEPDRPPRPRPPVSPARDVPPVPARPTPRVADAAGSAAAGRPAPRVEPGEEDEAGATSGLAPPSGPASAPAYGRPLEVSEAGPGPQWPPAGEPSIRRAAAIPTPGVSRVAPPEGPGRVVVPDTPDRPPPPHTEAAPSHRSASQERSTADWPAPTLDEAGRATPVPVVRGAGAVEVPGASPEAGVAGTEPPIPARVRPPRVVLAPAAGVRLSTDRAATAGPAQGAIRLATPLAGADGDRTGPETPETVVTVSIGRIEIRAVADARPARPAARPAPAVMGLSEYLERRARGG